MRLETWSIWGNIMRTCETRAFTLIEMLLVIAIIVVLAGLLYPVFSKVRESGRSTRCVSNLRQLQLAAMNASGGASLPYSVSWSEPQTDPYTGAIISYIHRAGWVSWYSHYNNEVKPTDSFTKNYDWRDTDTGLGTITNGTLWAHLFPVEPAKTMTGIKAMARAVYCCPTAALTAQGKTALRSYSMNSAANHMSLLGGGGTICVLFVEDTPVTTGSGASAAYDGEVTTNLATRIHNGRGNVIYVDGHVEKW